jgi:hypothetical protein
MKETERAAHFRAPHLSPDAYANPGTSREGAASVCPGPGTETHAKVSLGTPTIGARMADAAMDRSHELKGRVREESAR